MDQLLAAGANVTAVNKAGKSVLSYAKNKEIRRLLISKKQGMAQAPAALSSVSQSAAPSAPPPPPSLAARDSKLGERKRTAPPGLEKQGTATADSAESLVEGMSYASVLESHLMTVGDVPRLATSEELGSLRFQLIEAVKKDDIAWVQGLDKRGAKDPGILALFKEISLAGETFLHHSIALGYTKVARYLLKNIQRLGLEFALTHYDNQGICLLIRALEEGRVSCVKLLLEHIQRLGLKSALTHCDKEGDSPLLVALARGHILGVRLLIEASKVLGVSELMVNMQNPINGLTPLMKAVDWAGDDPSLRTEIMQIIRDLIALGADVRVVDKENSPIEAYTSDMSIYLFLQEQRPLAAARAAELESAPMPPKEPTRMSLAPALSQQWNKRSAVVGASASPSLTEDAHESPAVIPN